MKENEIRPTRLRKKVEELFKKDAKDLLSHRKKFIEVKCPACGSGKREEAFMKRGYRFRKCKKCRTYYISPRPKPELLRVYYSTSRASRFWQDYIFPQSRKVRIEKIFKPRADLIFGLAQKYSIGNDLLIDVGAGAGFFGEEMRKRSFFKKIVLIEPGPIKIEGDDVIDVINDAFENVNLNLKPDIITNFELIEHLFSPMDFLRKVHSLMKKESFFIFTTPNMEGFELFTVFDKSPNVAGPDHLNYFNIDSIRLLLERTGFKDIEVTTPGELDADIVRNKHNEGLIDLRNDPFLYHMLIKSGDKFIESFQGFLKNNKLSSNMLVLAKK